MQSLLVLRLFFCCCFFFARGHKSLSPLADVKRVGTNYIVVRSCAFGTYLLWVQTHRLFATALIYLLYMGHILVLVFVYHNMGNYCIYCKHTNTVNIHYFFFKLLIHEGRHRHGERPKGEKLYKGAVKTQTCAPSLGSKRHVRRKEFRTISVRVRVAHVYFIRSRYFASIHPANLFLGPNSFLCRGINGTLSTVGVIGSPQDNFASRIFVEYDANT